MVKLGAAQQGGPFSFSLRGDGAGTVSKHETVDEGTSLPTDHPLWETQVALEKGMTQEGARRVQDAVAITMQRGQHTRLDPYRSLLEAWLPKVAVQVQEWVSSHNRSRAQHQPMAHQFLKECDPFVASLIALRCVLDGVATKRGTEITTLARHIGSEVEHEQKVRLWEKDAPGLYHDRQKRLKRQGADARHTRRTNIHEFNRLLSERKFGEGWQDWTSSEQVSVGAALLNCLMIGTGWFTHEPVETGGPDRKDPPLCLVFKPGMDKWIGDRLAKLEECSPALKPTVIPPKRWTGMMEGGYWTPYVHHRDLISFKAIQVDQRFNARQEYNALAMPRVYQALHFLQETPWRINQRVYKVVHEALQKHCTWAGLPNYRTTDAPPRPIEVEMMSPSERKAWRLSEAGRQWRRDVSAAQAKDIKNVVHRKRAERILQVAEEYKGFDRIYFPHYLDWRGRMYPIPQFLQPQGDDLARGLLEFAEGKRVTVENGGYRWLCINLASAWGKDKVSFDDRVKWVEDNCLLWDCIASDPVELAHEWTGCDKPWQALAAIFDWVGYHRAEAARKPYQSHAVVAVDGTCNGLQHLSAMTADEVVGAHVNLTPGDKPQDIYQFVGDRLLPELQRLAKARTKEGKHAKYWLGLAVDGKLPRNLLKRPVMILAYSATKTAFYEYTRKELNEIDPPPSRTGDEKADAKARTLRTERITLFVNLLWAAIQENLPRQMRAMQWLQECAKLASTGNQPIYWMTPDGLVVRHFYGKLSPKWVRTKLDGQVHCLKLWEPTKDLDGAKQRLGISPNFVHSLDAAAARGCIIRAEEEGHVTAFASVHDSFGTHAADMERLYGYLRLAFVDVHAVGALQRFRQACLGVMRDEMMARLHLDYLEASQIADEKLPPVPDMGTLNLMEVLHSDYFFA